MLNLLMRIFFIIPRHLGISRLFVLMSLVSTAALAREGDREQPIQIDADTVVANHSSLVSDFDGHVVLIQGTLQILAEHVHVSEDAQGFKTLLATGEIVSFRQQTDDLKWMEGQAKNIEYREATHQIELKQKAWVKRDQDLVKGDDLIYNTITQMLQAKSVLDTPHDRVHLTLQPAPKTQGAVLSQPPSSSTSLQLEPSHE